MSSKTPRVIKYGNDIFLEIRCPNLNSKLKITYWDLWIAIIVFNIFNTDWDKMIDYLRRKTEEDYYQRDKVEALLNHIRQLYKTLSEAELSIGDILEKADAQFLKKQESKAKKKILEMNFNFKEKSNWMIYTPRKILEARAMRGHWNHFPVNPQKYASSFERLYKSSRFYGKNQTHTLERKLSDLVNKREARASHHEIFSLYRAFLTVVIEKMVMVDDSYGVIGELYEEIFKKYFLLDRTKLEMPLSDFFFDFVELIIWEDYGFTERDKPNFFVSLISSEIPLVESILKKLKDELNKFELDYQAENALTLLGMLYVQHQLFDKFVPIAKEMGTRHWERITTMSEMAEKHQKYELALAVYETCLSPGFHEEFLREKYQGLKRRCRKKTK